MFYYFPIGFSIDFWRLQKLHHWIIHDLSPSGVEHAKLKNQVNILRSGLLSNYPN